MNLYGQEKLKYQPPDTRILFIFDASQSMMGYWQKNKKIDIARKVMIHMMRTALELQLTILFFLHLELLLKNETQ